MLEQFYKDCRDELNRWCISLTGDPELAEALVHAAFVRAMDRLPALEPLTHSQKKAWFYRTIKNMYIDRVRRRRFETVSEVFPGNGRNAPEYDSIDWELLLEGLPGKEGVFFAMRYLRAIPPQRSEVFSASLQEQSARSSRLRGNILRQL